MTPFTPPPVNTLFDSPRLIALLVVGFILCAALLSATGLSVWLAIVLGIPLGYLLEGVILYLMKKSDRSG